MAFNERVAGVDPPRDLGNFSPNQRRVVIKASAPDCNVRLTLGKIEFALLHDQLDCYAWILQMKGIKEAGINDALTYRHVARQLDQASRAPVERRRLALQCIDGRFNLLSMRQQVLAMGCQSVYPRLSFGKRAI